MANPITQAQVMRHEATPGSVGGTVQQAPLPTTGPRDALIIDGHNDQDYVPDADRLHQGFVAQPSIPVRDGSGNVIGYLAAEDAREMLQVPKAPVTLRDLKAGHNRLEASAEWQRHITPLGPAPLGEEDSYAYNAGDDSNPRVKAAQKRAEERNKAAKAEAEAVGSGSGEPSPYQALQARAKELGIPATGNTEALTAAIEAEEQRQADKGNQDNT
jgi:hypothetical protein